MHVSKKEFEAIHAALDFIENAADGADEDKYPHDIMSGLRSLFEKAKQDRWNKQVSYYVKKKLKARQPK